MDPLRAAHPTFTRRANFFVVHNAWHEALFRSEAGDIDGALAIDHATLHNDQSAKVALGMLDATALLWRLHLDGIDVGDRWAPLADAWANKTEHDSWYGFNDTHAANAYVGAGRLADTVAALHPIRKIMHHFGRQQRPARRRRPHAARGRDPKRQPAARRRADLRAPRRSAS